MKYNKI